MADEDIWSWSTTAVNNGTADSGISWPEGQTRASVNNSARAMMAAHAKSRNLLSGTIVTTGTASAQRFVSGVGYTVIPTGIQVLLKIGTGLTSVDGTVTTLNMDSIGDVPVKNQRGEDVEDGLIAGTYAHFIYDGTNWIWLEAELLTIINNLIGDTITTITNTIATTIINQTTITTTTGPVAMVDFTDIDTTEFPRYSLVGTDIVPEVDHSILSISVSTDNGVTFPITVESYNAIQIYASERRASASIYPFQFYTNAGFFPISWALDAIKPQYPYSFVMDLFSFQADKSPTITWSTQGWDDDFEFAQLQDGRGFVRNTPGVNALRIWLSSGNFVSGTFTLYGYK